MKWIKRKLLWWLLHDKDLVLKFGHSKVISEYELSVMHPDQAKRMIAYQERDMVRSISEAMYEAGMFRVEKRRLVSNPATQITMELRVLKP